MKAKEYGAKVIQVEPRYSRTSAMADLWVRIRSGTERMNAYSHPERIRFTQLTLSAL